MGLLGAAASATAAPILYNINFTTTSGIAPTAGSFTYDSAIPLSFTSFIVQWNSFSFDLTSTANAPFLEASCATPSPDGVDLFGYLSGLCGISGRTWHGERAGAFALFSVGNGGGGIAVAAILGLPVLDPFDAAFANGFFTISQATPEPSTSWLMLAGGALLAWRRRRTVRSGMEEPSQQ